MTSIEVLGSCTENTIITELKNHENMGELKKLQDASKEMEREKFEHIRRNPHFMCVHWNCNSDITGRGGAWRPWSSIWLSHLFQNIFESLSNNQLPQIEQLLAYWQIKNESWAIKANFIGKLLTRGKYNSRRKDFWWKEKTLSGENPKIVPRDVLGNYEFGILVYL